MLLIFFALKAQGATKQYQAEIVGRVESLISGAVIKDTIRVELLRPDSSLVVSTRANVFYDHYPDESSIFNPFVIVTECARGDYLLRLSHPDYADAYYPISINKAKIDAGNLKVRKLTSLEKKIMLGELTVTASVVQFVNRGDTISYNADAFDLAQGSMLDALISQLPGVEIKDGGQIYVNGRFVDKLLLDGKDFFEGDKLVLLQNLPAYTVKNVKVYEQASAASEVLGRGATDFQNPDKYVMDVVLKKGYNAGWLANAEAGGGTHDRYMGRLFGSRFTKALRLSAYGFANNINQTATPGGTGDWSSPDDKSGETTTRGGGLDYGYFSSSGVFQITGNAIVRHTNTIDRQYSNTQNFLANGNTYTRAWNDSRNRNLSVQTGHNIQLRPKNNNSSRTDIKIDFLYNRTRTRSDATEGTFNKDPGSSEGLRQMLEAGLPEGFDAVNRQIENASSLSRPLSLKYDVRSVWQLGENGYGLSFDINGFYMRSTLEAADSYTLQYAGLQPTGMARHNPRNSHSYKYWLGPRFTIPIGSNITFNPRIAYSHQYDNDRSLWYEKNADNSSESEAGEILGALRSMEGNPWIENLQNSYRTGYHRIHQFISMAFSYNKSTFENGKENSRLQLFANLAGNTHQDILHFRAKENIDIKKNYVTPSSQLYLFWYMKGMAPLLEFKYEVDGTRRDLMNLLEYTFDSDPLNIQVGNPHVKVPVYHKFSVGYDSRNDLFGRLWLYARGLFEFRTNEIVMSYSYNRATGVKTLRPANVDGYRYGWVNVGWRLWLDRRNRFFFSNTLYAMPGRVVDVMSEDGFQSLQTSIMHVFYVNNHTYLGYQNRDRMLRAEFGLESRHASSANNDFTPFTMTKLRYGLSGRSGLPYGFEVSTDLIMHSTRGFDDPSMNRNQLVWNARVSKSFFNGQLFVIADGYDILQQVHNISYKLNAQRRQEIWVNNIPSYVMFSVKWMFSKRPRE